jgi:hypothetical protein
VYRGAREGLEGKRGVPALTLFTPKNAPAVSRLKSLRLFHLYIFFSFGARAADHILPRFAQSGTLKVGHHRTKETKNPPASEGGHYRRTRSPTRRSWLDWEVATRVLVEKR